VYFAAFQWKQKKGIFTLISHDVWLFDSSKCLSLSLPWKQQFPYCIFDKCRS
jgi:hypothetical protein